MNLFLKIFSVDSVSMQWGEREGETGRDRDEWSEAAWKKECRERERDKKRMTERERDIFSGAVRGVT